MKLSKLALIAGVLLTSLLGGVALGSFTIGGFRVDQPSDTMGLFLAERSTPGISHEAAGPVLLTQGEQVHVCTGCDAKLYRADPGRYDPSLHDETALQETYAGYKDQPARQDYADDESRDAAVTAYYDGAPDKAERQAEPDDGRPVALATSM